MGSKTVREWLELLNDERTKVLMCHHELADKKFSEKYYHLAHYWLNNSFISEYLNDIVVFAEYDARNNKARLVYRQFDEEVRQNDRIVRQFKSV